jgi:hypothetical protein
MVRLMRSVLNFAGMALLAALAVFTAAGAVGGGLMAYTDTEAGFGLAYPRDLAMRKIGKGSYFSLESAEGAQIVVGEIYRLASFPREMFKGSRDVFRDFAVNRALARCSADGVDGTAYCRNVYRILQTANANGLRLIELYLVHMQVQYGEVPESTHSVVGPVYALDISRPADTVLLIVSSLPDARMSDEQMEIARDITASVRLLPMPRPDSASESVPEPASPRPKGRD